MLVVEGLVLQFEVFKLFVLSIAIAFEEICEVIDPFTYTHFALGVLLGDAFFSAAEFDFLQAVLQTGQLQLHVVFVQVLVDLFFGHT